MADVSAVAAFPEIEITPATAAAAAAAGQDVTTEPAGTPAAAASGKVEVPTAHLPVNRAVLAAAGPAEAKQKAQPAAAEDAEGEIVAYERYCAHKWNVNNFPRLAGCHGSMLQYVDDAIPGIVVPWLYVGMQFSSFCWHVEDHLFYSVNYHHYGEPKRWYSVPASARKAFEVGGGALEGWAKP
jgi:hypothetical protein